jgi:hypothetical protein
MCVADPLCCKISDWLSLNESGTHIPHPAPPLPHFLVLNSLIGQSHPYTILGQWPISTYIALLALKWRDILDLPPNDK